MGNLFNSLNKLKSNIFGGPGNTGFTKPPATRVAKLGLKDTPTSLLDVDPTAFASYSYPRDVTNNVQNGHYMLFYINVQNRSKFEYQNPEGGKLTTVTKVSKKKWKAGGGKVIGTDKFGNDITAGTYYNEVKDLHGEHKGEVEYYRKRAGAPSVSQFEDGSRNRNSRGGIAGKMPTTTRISDSVAIYLPPNVQDSLGATYNDTETGMLGFAAAAGLDFSNAVGAKDYEAAANALVGGAGGVLTEGAKKAGAALAETLAGAEGAAGMVNRVFGQADNPYVEVLFQAMEVRTFTYNFTFAPKNEQEALEVQKIIQLFRFHMAPELRPGVNRYLGLPSQFDLHYMYLSKDGATSENNFYNRIATCVLQNCDVNYTPNGVKSFEDGGPVTTTMTLAFKEIELLTKDKIAEGY